MPRRSKIQRDRDKVRISQLYLQGMTQVEIAGEIGVSQRIISDTLAVCRDEWKTLAALNIDEMKARELAKIDALEVEYWNAWKRSQEDEESSSSKMVGKNEKGPDKLEKTIRTRGQVGDPRFLAGVERCIERRCRILGIDAPIKNALTDPSGAHEAENKVVIYIPTNGRDQIGAGERDGEW